MFIVKWFLMGPKWSHMGPKWSSMGPKGYPKGTQRAQMGPNMENVPKLREGCSDMEGASRSVSELRVKPRERGYILIWSSDWGVLTYMA